MHKLIIGDNYDALQQLLITHRGMIDVIYIDPPYGCDSMGQFADMNYTNSLTRDNLLSMLYPRLQLAKQLLSDDGVIFVSIDDKNQAQVKGLMDEIFLEENFVGMAPRKTCDIIRKVSDSELQSIFDYVIIYKMEFTKFTKEITNQKTYPFEDENGKYFLSAFQNSGPNSTRRARPHEYYPIYLNSDGSLSLEPTPDTTREIYPKPSGGEDGRWLWSKGKFEKDKHLLVFSGDTIKKKRYSTEFEDDNVYQSFKLWLDDKEFRNNKGTLMLSSIVAQGCFDNPKPVDLIKWLINLCPNKNAIVLDFFAGSGTTGHAVLELNREDNGHRTYILCTNNEETVKTPNGIAYDVTAKRLRRIMCGICYDGCSDFKWLENNQPYGDNLDVYEIESVNNSEQDSGKSPFDVIDETCYDMPKFASVQEKIAWVCNNFENTQKYIKEEE